MTLENISARISGRTLHMSEGTPNHDGDVPLFCDKSDCGQYICHIRPSRNNVRVSGGSDYVKKGGRHFHVGHDV